MVNKLGLQVHPPPDNWTAEKSTVIVSVDGRPILDMVREAEVKLIKTMEPPGQTGLTRDCASNLERISTLWCGWPAKPGALLVGAWRTIRRCQMWIHIGRHSRC